MIAKTQQELYYLSTNLWGTRNVNVCWTADGNDAEKLWVRQALSGDRSWVQSGNINLIGWGRCGANATGIRLTAGSEMVSHGLGRQSNGAVDVTLDFTSSPQTRWTQCTANSLGREDCIKAVALHEFGHALGIAHEQNRSDKPASCLDAPQGSNGDTMFGPWDESSIMNYCADTADLSGTDRRGFERMYGIRNSNPPHLEDSNGDGRADLLCHDTVTGYKWIDYASTTGTYAVADWNTTSGFCSHTTGRLFGGDFNGDGRRDLLCHDVSSGYKWVDFASTAGAYEGTDWSTTAGFCSHNTGRLLIGDFNGDGRDDLLCHDTASGYKWIDYASSTGAFDGTDWTTTSSFCGHTTGRLFVGDFNGDGRSDLLCHDAASGYKWIDYASTTGAFGVTDWSTTGGFCSHSSGQLFVSDFNGDGKDDLLCHDVESGYKWIDYASSTGTFTGTDWSTTGNFCSHATGRIFVGDINGDGRGDLLCHDVQSGAAWVDYASTTGTFLGTDWSMPSGWCSHDAAELH